MSDDTTATAPDVSISMSTHVGDDATETDDLTVLEYGIHCRLRRALWRRGGVLGGDRGRLRLLVGAVTDADVAALTAVIFRLWVETEDGRIAHPATMAEIDRARAKKASYQARGRMGGRPAKADGELDESIAFAGGEAGGKTPPPPPPPTPTPDPPPPPEPDLDKRDPLTEETRPDGGPSAPVGVGDGAPVLQLVPKERDPETTKARKPDTASNITAVFQHYHQKHHHPMRRRPQSTSKTWRAIAARLRDGWSMEELFKAIDGYHLSPFHQGQNDKGEKHLELELFMRDEEHVQKGINFAENPPKPGNGASAARDVRVGSVRAEDCRHDGPTGVIPL